MLKHIGPCAAEFVSLNAARCLIQRRFDLQVLKPLVACSADRQGASSTEIAAAGTRRGRPSKAGGLRDAGRLPSKKPHEGLASGLIRTTRFTIALLRLEGDRRDGHASPIFNGRPVAARPCSVLV